MAQRDVDSLNAGQVLDEMVAEIMGYTIESGTAIVNGSPAPYRCWVDEHGSAVGYTPYSRCRDYIFLVLDRMRGFGYRLRLSDHDGWKWKARFVSTKDENHTMWTGGDTMEEAVCKAAVKAWRNR